MWLACRYSRIFLGGKDRSICFRKWRYLSFWFQDFFVFRFPSDFAPVVVLIRWEDGPEGRLGILLYTLPFSLAYPLIKLLISFSFAFSK